MRAATQAWPPPFLALQQMQPFSSSTQLPSGAASPPCGSFTSARSTSAESPISFSSTAQRQPCLALRMKLTRVVFPACRWAVGAKLNRMWRLWGGAEWPWCRSAGLGDDDSA